jgi:uncharacterized membrane protein
MSQLTEIIELGTITFFLVIVLLLLAWISVALRLWVRLGITKSPGWDDAMMVMALCLFTCYCAFILVIATAGAAHGRQFTTTEIIQNLVVSYSHISLHIYHC